MICINSAALTRDRFHYICKFLYHAINTQVFIYEHSKNNYQMHIYNNRHNYS